MRKYRYYLGSIINLLFGFRNWPLIVRIFLSRSRSPQASQAGDVYEVRLRRNGLRFKVRGKMDVWSIKEALIDRFYSPPGYKPQDGWVVIDVGAGIGEYTLEAAAKNPASIVFAFEPFLDSCLLLRENLHINTVKNVQVFQKAIWAKSGNLNLNLEKGEPLQLTSHAIDAANANGSENTVECTSLADVLEQNKIVQVDVLKMDCEGAEYDILLGTPAETLGKIKRIVMEYHDLDASRHHARLVEHLSSCGYQVQSMTNQVHADLGYIFASRA